MTLSLRPPAQNDDSAMCMRFWGGSSVQWGKIRATRRLRNFLLTHCGVVTATRSTPKAWSHGTITALGGQMILYVCQMSKMPECKYLTIDPQSSTRNRLCDASRNHRMRDSKCFLMEYVSLSKLPIWRIGVSGKHFGRCRVLMMRLSMRLNTLPLSVTLG